MIQKHYWTMNEMCHGGLEGTMSYFGEILTQNVGCFSLTGRYNINSREKVIVHIAIEE